MELAAFVNLFVLAGATVSMIGGVDFVRTQDQRQRDQDRATYVLTFPKELSAAQVQDWTNTISGTPPTGLLEGFPATAFEIWSNEHGFKYRLHVPKRLAGYVVDGLQTMAPGMHVVPDDSEPEHRWIYIVEYGEEKIGMPLRIPSQEKVAATLLSSMQNPLPGDEMLMQLVVTPAALHKLPKYLPPPRTNSLGMGMLLNQLATSKEEIDARRAKMQQPNMHAVIRVGVRAKTFERASVP